MVQQQSLSFLADGAGWGAQELLCSQDSPYSMEPLKAPDWGGPRTLASLTTVGRI